MFTMQRALCVKALVICAMSLLIGVLTTASSQAVTVNGTIFSDDFDSLDNWPAAYAYNGNTSGTVTVSAGVATFSSPAVGSVITIKTDPLDFSASPNDWAAEVGFSLTGNVSSTSGRSNILLAGNMSTDDFQTFGFDLRALAGATSDVWDLGWAGNDNYNPSRDHTLLTTGLLKDTFYDIVVHANGGNVDIYVDDALVSTQPLLAGLNPVTLLMGDPSSSSSVQTVIVDRVRVGEFVNGASLTGDLNGDGFVGQDDLNFILGKWGTIVTPGSFTMGDPSGDGFVGQDDLNILLGHWGEGTPPLTLAGSSLSATAVPEPHAVLLLAVGGMLAVLPLRGRWRRQ